MQAEYQHALSSNKPCFVYFKDEQTPVPPAYVEQDQSCINYLNAFKNDLKSKHVISWFSTPQDLARIVTTDLHKYILDNLIQDKSYVSQPISLSDIIPRGMLELVLEGLSQRFQIPIGLYTPEKGGDFYSYPQHLNFSRYCRALRSTSTGENLCINADKAIAIECMKSGQRLTYKCHAGVTDFAVPILTGNTPIGVIFAGQVVATQEPSAMIEVKNFAQKVGMNEEKLIDLFKEMPVHSKQELDELINAVTEVSSYFSRLAREKSIYATESSFKSDKLPSQENMYLCEQMSTKDIISILSQLTGEEFTLSLLVPCLERAGFQNVQYCRGLLDTGYDLHFEYPDPMGFKIHYGALVKMDKIHDIAGTANNISTIIKLVEVGLSTSFDDKLTGESTHIDQYWVICPHEITYEDMRLASLKIKPILEQQVLLLVGERLVNTLLRQIPSLLDGLIRAKRNKKLILSA